MAKEKVLFLCTQNSARSQMAEALLRNMSGDKYEVYSAGTQPYRVNPFAIKVIEELGIDMSAHYSKGMDDFIGMDFDYVVTVCDNAKENCPYFPGAINYIHRSFSDPAAVKGSDEEILQAFRNVRDEIREWINKCF